MKVNQIVGEHKKGVRAKIYTRKPKAGPAPRQPIKQNEIEHPRDIKEGHHHFHDWMNSEHAPYDDDAGDYHKVHQKAREYLHGKVHPSEVDDHAELLNREYHGEHEQEVDEDDVVKSVAGDKAVVNIAGQDQEVAASNLMPGAQPGTVALKPPEDGEIKPGMKITGSDVQSEEMLPNKVFAGTAVGQKPGRDGQWRNKGPKANSPAKAGDLVGGMEESMSAEDKALLDKMLTIARLR
jgi:hypothetical protein